jgi:hypothetical protein
MSEDVLSNAFSMFYTTKPREMGTGLGLSLVARVIEHAHGTVHVQSRVGTGTTVSVLLPIAAAGFGGPVRPAAAVILKDERAGDLIRHLLGAAGASVTVESQPDNASIWVVEPTKANLDRAMAWRARKPAGALLLLGKPVRGTIRGWHSLHPLTIENPDDLNAIRDAVGRAIHGS